MKPNISERSRCRTFLLIALYYKSVYYHENVSISRESARIKLFKACFKSSVLFFLILKNVELRVDKIIGPSLYPTGL